MKAMNERNPLGQAREAYESLRIPDELPDAVQDAVRQARREARRERSGNHFLRYAVCAAACLCVIFVVALNAVPVLAQEMYGVPVLGHMARIFTLNRFEESSEESYVVVNVPALENTGNTELERRVNYEIALKINEQVAEAKQRAKEYYQAYLETGGKKSEFLPIEIHVDYSVKCSNGEIVSFVVQKYEAGASFYSESFYYNYDLETGKALTLANLLGDGYIEKVNEAVRAGIAADEAANPEEQYFHDEMIPGFESIEEDQDFYINEAGHGVVVFPQYAIAPGYMGEREFEVLP